MKPSISAINTFYYYHDLGRALDFYCGTLGLELAADFGFAKMVQSSPTSFFTLMDLAYSQHAPDEPKTVTTAFATEEVEAWYDMLRAAGVPIHHELKPDVGKAHEGFVALDPEGYYLEFERFNPHPENEQLLPLLQSIRPINAGPEGALPITATVLWLYYEDMPGIARFLREGMGLSMVVDQGFAQIYPIARSAFIGPVRAGEGLHPYSEKKLVTIALITDEFEAWLDRLQRYPEFDAKTASMDEVADRVRFFYGLDPEGYFMEFDTFLDVEANTGLRQRLRSGGD
ncbi:MAG: VOC family protein [Caldilineaceae bacterium]|nr:VOC family protein [Caldilineaceae bacterium]